MMNNDQYTYRVTWSPDDDEYIALCAEFPSLSWLDQTPELHRRLVMEASEAGVSLNRLASNKLSRSVS